MKYPSKKTIEKREKEELKYFFKLFKKIIESKTLTNREAIDVCSAFMIMACEYNFKDGYGDYLYNKILDVQIKQKSHSSYQKSNDFWNNKAQNCFIASAH